MTPSAGSDPPNPEDEALVRTVNVFAAQCPSRELLDHVVTRWSVLALAALTDGPYRFGALRRQVGGISERMLSQTLHVLERDGLIHRDVQSTFPPRVEYRLTPAGERLAAPLKTVIAAVHSELPGVMAHRARVDAVDTATTSR